MKCIACKNKNIKFLNNFGKIPRSHDFKKKNSTKKYNFNLNQCKNCSVIQLKKSGIDHSFIPNLKWVKNNEPDKHLNELISFLRNKLKEKKRILLVSNFDKRILDTLKNFSNLKLLESKRYLKIQKENPSQFLIQKSIVKKIYSKKIFNIGKFDFIVSCRVLEHTYNFNLFVKNLEFLLKPSGNFIFEIPDSEKSLKQGDIAMLWEEHPMYFTKKSIIKAFQVLGYKVLDCKRYFYPQEDALIIRIKKNLNTDKIKNSSLSREFDLGKTFIKKTSQKKEKLVNYLRKQKERKKKIAIFGAGHRSVVYFHANKLLPFIDYIFDDDKKKKTYFFLEQISKFNLVLIY